MQTSSGGLVVIVVFYTHKAVSSCLIESFSECYERFEKAPANKGVKRKQQSVQQVQSTSKKKKPIKIPPNYFIAIQIANPTVSTLNYVASQQEILGYNLTHFLCDEF